MSGLFLSCDSNSWTRHHDRRLAAALVVLFCGTLVSYDLKQPAANADIQREMSCATSTARWV